MTAGSRPVRRRPFRALIGILLIALGVCLLCWAAFHIARGPSTCGGDAPACPDGFLFAVLGGFASFFVVLPVGIALSPKVAGLPSVVGILISGGLAATVYSSRFVADPIAEGTVGTWIAVGVLGTIAVLFLVSLLVSGGDGSDADAIRAKLADRSEVELSDGETGDTSSRTTAATASAAGSARKPPASAKATTTTRTADGTQIDLGMDTIRQLLLQGLTNGELATKVEVGRISPDHRQDVQRLLDLHQRGVIDDDALRDALTALRST